MRLFSVAGIPVYATSTFLAGVIGWYVVLSRVLERIDYVEQPQRVAAFLTLLIQLSVLAHEIGHASAARAQGGRMIRIRLTALGGEAAALGVGRTAGDAFRFVVGGPAMTAGMVLLCELVLAGFGWTWHDGTWGLFVRQPASDAELTVVILLVFNLGTLVYNLAPAIPLDGGHLLKALIWHRSRSRSLGTYVAGGLGVCAGLALLVLGMSVVSRPGGSAWNVTLVAVGLWQVVGAVSEISSNEKLERLARLTVSDVLLPEAVTLPPGKTVAAAWRELFVPRAQMPFAPVVEESGRYLGMVHRGVLREAAVWEPDSPLGKFVEPPDTDGLAVVAKPDTSLEEAASTDACLRGGAVVATDASGNFVGLTRAKTIARRAGAL